MSTHKASIERIIRETITNSGTSLSPTDIQAISHAVTEAIAANNKEIEKNLNFLKVLIDSK